MFSRFFIDRPIFASVLSIVITLAGGIAVLSLPIAQYPEITPPTVEVSAYYPGANAQVVADTVAAPVEERVNGVENMLYMSSQCTNDGMYTLTVTFRIGVDLNMAQVLVQNKVSLAERIVAHLSRRGMLPAEPTDEQRAVVRAATPLVNERMQVLSEAEGMLGFLLVDERDFHVDVDDAGKVLTKDAVHTLETALHALENVEPWTTEGIEAALRAALVEGLGLKPKLAFGPVRVAATGRRVSPPLFESLELLGRDRSLDRLRAGLALADE